MKRGSLHTKSFRRIHLSVFRYRLVKNGFPGPNEKFLVLSRNGPLARIIRIPLGLFEMQWIARFALFALIHWIEIFPVDSVIQPLNDWGLAGYVSFKAVVRLSMTAKRQTAK